MTDELKVGWVRRLVGKWHPGQLIMAWIALIIVWLVLGLTTLLLLDHANAVDYRRKIAARDAAARTPENLARARDSAQKLISAGAPDYQVNSYLRDDVGLQPKSFVPPNASDLRLGTAARGISFAAMALLFALPVVGFVMTWTWFGERQARRIQGI